jgi:hypothetical protein
MVRHSFRKAVRFIRITQKQNDEEALLSSMPFTLFKLQKVRIKHEPFERDALVAAAAILVFMAIQIGVFWTIYVLRGPLMS